MRELPSALRVPTGRDRKGVAWWIAALLFILSLCGCPRHKETGLNPGDIPPDFEIIDLHGATQSLKQYRGKVILLNFWASWCQPCVAELPSLQKLYSEFESKGLVVLGIGIDDDKDSLTEFQRGLNLTFPILLDLQGFSKGKFRVSGVPESFFIDREGKLVLFADPESDAPAVRIIGPREWDSAAMRARVKALLGEGA